MRVISFSEARKHLKSVLDTVNDDANATIVTRRDADDAVVMSLDYYNSLMETVYLLKSPANAAHLAKSIAQYQAGKTAVRDLRDNEDVEDADSYSSDETDAEDA
ncbi:MAG: type II toxin-antitoxin system Phd/YefM family antitoxin [Psychrobacter celer]|jgi:antitoxin YefM|uniref:type II toxin-antitoxin system Phd/YefM family antitoxin n=1 Tax=Psychrobacter TaxID=497 RepID=UPI001EE0D3B2|nr:type II toxin-antitoxin system prevent-host-death family antitoxin [Psychrobacter sp. Ps3]MCG3881273.1 type II toxin-antitoxin system prevent-host-death family antitoxin [Psychrobacter sp. Ps3]MDN5732677.1 type II toxin-antitoxin system prevent-host-death family antitoxin [Psychrobacter sp.]